MCTDCAAVSKRTINTVSLVKTYLAEVKLAAMTTSHASNDQRNKSKVQNIGTSGPSEKYCVLVSLREIRIQKNILR